MAWLLFLAALSASFLLMGEVDTLRHLEGRPLALAAVTSIALLALDIFLPVPSSIVMTFNGTMFSFLGGALVSLSGLLAGAVLGYWISRLYGKKVIRLIVGNRADGTVGPFFERFGIVAVIISRPIPLIAETTTCMAGTADMPFRPFMLGQIVGGIPLAFGYAWAGEFAGAQGSAFLALTIAVMVPSILWFVWAVTRQSRRRVLAGQWAD
jgi:3-dehydroquinate synthase